MTAKKKSSRAMSRSSHASEKAAPSVDGLLSMVDPTPWADQPSAPAKASGPRVGKIIGIDSQGRPLVAFTGMTNPGSAKNGSARTRPAKDRIGMAGKAGEDCLPARSTVRVTASDAGREALIAFENGDLGLPIITGLLQAPEELPARIEMQAGKELVLKCGPASITLTKDGRIVIRGADVLTRSSGSNRIKGGSVHIN